MMKLLLTSLTLIAALAFAACSSGSNNVAHTQPGSGGDDTNSSVATSTSTASTARTDAEQAPGSSNTSISSNANSSTNTNTVGTTGTNRVEPVGYERPAPKQQAQPSLAQTDAERAAAIAAGRKIISNAELSLELDDPVEGQRKIARIAAAHGGFVVTSDVRQQNGEDQTRSLTSVSITARVPSEQFVAAVDEIRGVATRVRQDKITGQDVTEEFYDLEARIRAKKALEAQFMEIMKQAHNVSDALQVQSELADVRTEIERLEGRKRYLDNQSSLSTINVTLSTPAQFVGTSSTGFAHDLKHAFGSGVDIAAAITLFLVQALLALLPLALLIFLPLGLLVRYLVRRNRRLQLARSLVQDEDGPIPHTR